MRYTGKIHDIQRNKLAVKAFAEGDEKPTMFVLKIKVEMVRNLKRNDIVWFDLDDDGECTWMEKIDL